MGTPCSTDLRERIVADVEAGRSCRAAARLAAACREHGDIRPKPRGRAPGTAGELAGPRAFLLEIVRAEPDITLKGLAGAGLEAHGATAQLSSLPRALQRAGRSHEKRTGRGRAGEG